MRYLEQRALRSFPHFIKTIQEIHYTESLDDLIPNSSFFFSLIYTSRIRLTMDGLGAAASVIAVVQVAQSVGGALMEYYEGVKSAREDIKRLYYSIKNLESVLKSVDNLPHTFSINIQAPLENKTGTLSLCKAELDSIKKELDAFSKQQNHIGKLKSLIWPFKKKDVDKHVDFIDKHKHDLMLAFGVENL